MYRFHQVLSATHSPHKALAESTPSAAMLGGIWMEANVAIKMGFEPWLPDGLGMDMEEIARYDLQADRVVECLDGIPGLEYQPVLSWPWGSDEIVSVRQAEGHPDFLASVEHEIIDLKTTEYPTEELLNRLLHSIQMCSYIAAYECEHGVMPSLQIILASRLVEPEPVLFNKNGTVSLSGQNADHASLLEAVSLMGDKADERHWAMVYKAPVWCPIMVGTLDVDECRELARIGTIFLDAGLAILNTGLAESIYRPYT